MASSDRGNPGIDPPSDDGREPVVQTTRVERQEIRVGPLPDPADLRRYDEVVSGAADRIIRMAESQAAHSQDMERLSLQANVEAHRSVVRLQRFGQIGAVFVVTLGLTVAFVSALAGHDWFATAVATGCIGGIVASFLGTRARQGSPG